MTSGSASRGPRILVSADHEASCRRAAERILEAAAAVSGVFDLVLSGGSGPPPLFEMLAQGRPAPLPWERVRAFWSDERCVPPDHPESNYGVARRLLLDPVSIPQRNVHRMEGERGPEDGARAYRATLAGLFGARPPAFHVALLGLGSDGHTCSLFPGQPALRSTRAAEPARAPGGVEARITLTPAGLAGTRRVLFLVSGETKAEAVARTLGGEGAPDAWPARTIAAEEVVWLLDRAAASGLEDGRSREAR